MSPSKRAHDIQGDEDDDRGNKAARIHENNKTDMADEESTDQQQTTEDVEITIKLRSISKAAMNDPRPSQLGAILSETLGGTLPATSDDDLLAMMFGENRHRTPLVVASPPLIIHRVLRQPGLLAPPPVAPSSTAPSPADDMENPTASAEPGGLDNPAYVPPAFDLAGIIPRNSSIL